MSQIAETIEKYFDRLWPICRSITGPGYRESLEILSEIIPFNKISFPSHSQVLDWVVPKEWHPKHAYFIDPNGQKRADISVNNVHLLGYSVPFKGKVSFGELKKHLYTLPNQPGAIPYITSYYKERWGFCLSHNEFQKLPEGEYDVFIDTELYDGEVIIGEAVLPGQSEKEILFSTYLCHPSLANNELSGPLVLSYLYQELKKIKNHFYTYKFVIAPETIGTICYLSKRGNHLLKNLVAGYQLTCIGDAGNFTYKQSREGNTLPDRAAKMVLGNSNSDYSVVPFDPAVGSDERQYCSPGYNLPFGSIMRTMYTKYPEYHTSLDNKTLMSFDGMVNTIELIRDIVIAIEENKTYINTSPYGEPQLGRRGLFRSLSDKNRSENEIALWWLLNYSEGTNDLLSIAEKSKLPLEILITVAGHLVNAGLLRDK